ncbi:hypothetical protein JCM10296v2_001982 [Rhodotorula toruloides]
MAEMDPAGGALTDPTILSAQGRTDALVEAVETNDLLALVLVLQYAEPAEVNGHASSSGRTPLETALSFPTFRSDIRSFATQGLLHCGAIPPPSLDAYATGYARIVRDWESGGREQAFDAFQLVRVWTLEQVDAWIEEKGLGVDGQPGASVEAEQPTMDEEAGASTPIPQAKEERASPRIAKPDVSSNQTHEIQNLVRPTTTSPAPPPLRQGSPPPAPPAPVALSPPAHDPPASRPRFQTSSDASEPAPLPPHCAVSGSLRPRVLFTGLPKHVPLDEVRKLVWTEINYYPAARFTTSRQPDAVDVIVELRNDHELRLVLRRPNGVFLRNHRVALASSHVFTAANSPRALADASKSRLTSSPPISGTPPTIASPFAEAHVARERALYEALADVAAPEDIYVFHVVHVVKQPERTAYIAFKDTRTANDALDQLVSYRFDGHRIDVDWFRPAQGERDPLEPATTGLRMPYAGPSRNGSAILDSSYTDLVVSGVVPHARERDLRDSIELVVGRGSVKAVRMSVCQGVDRNRSAFVKMYRHSDALRAIDRADGFLFEGQAITVNWAYTSSAGQRAEKELEPGPARSSHSPARQSPSPSYPPSSHAQPPASPSQPPPSPPQTTAAVASKDRVRNVAQPHSKPEDLDALRYLGLPPPNLEAISQMWAPLDEAPLSRHGKPFDRHIRTKVKVGFVPQQDAEAALQDERMRTVFKDDPLLQQRFEVFLAAQAGHSKDWYLTFFAHIAEFNRLSRLFSETARRDAAKPL